MTAAGGPGGRVRGAGDSLVNAVARLTGGLSRRIGWRERRRTLELYAILAAQAGVAAALAWTVAHEILHHDQPIFAPTAAVGTIAAAIGRRTRRTVELLLGVLAGIVVGDALIAFMGTGPWQTGVVVTAAILLGLTLSRGGQVVSQAGGTAVLIAAATPAQRSGLETPRIIDAIVGGVAAIVVVAILPANPLRIIKRAARPLFANLIHQLQTTAEAMSAGDVDGLNQARDGLRDVESQLTLLNDALSGAEEAVAISPLRWHRRGEFEQYRRGARYLARIIHSSQEMVRRAATAVRDGEPMPSGLPAAVHAFSDALAQVQIEAESNAGTDRPAQLARTAVTRAAEAYADGVGFSGGVVVAQVRSVATDLLTSLGRDEREANATVREVFEKAS